ncbi:MAG: peptide chain release factor N(5)-glutamine methyltransferase [Chitinophagaceae bacterium]
MTIQEADRYIINQIANIYGKEEAQNISNLIMEHLTGHNKTNLLLNRQTKIAAEQKIQLDHYLPRLLNHEPVQYILNEAWFCGLKLYVDKNVLIPRPETEELADWVITDYLTYKRSGKLLKQEDHILDIGSGSGCLPLAIKKKLPELKIWSCDISPAALDVAKQNSIHLGIPVQFFELNVLDKEQTDNLPTFDIIVSNPPYIAEIEKGSMQKNVLDFEPAAALFVPDKDPLIFYKAIADFGKTHLAKKGMIYIEINERAARKTGAIFQSIGYNTEIRKDMQGKERMLKAWF